MLKATSFISPTVCPLSLDLLRIIQSVPLRTTHKHFVSSSLMPNSLFFPMLIKNRLRRAPSMRQSLVQLAEVIPTSSGRSSYPPSALTRGRLAHFSEIGIYAGNSVNRTDPD